MTEFLSSHTAKIRACRLNITSTIEKTRDYGCKASAIEEALELLIDHYEKILAAAENCKEEPEKHFQMTIPEIENAYMEWKALKISLEETLKLAYLGSIPQSNLILDDILAFLESRIGEPLASIYAQLQSKWKKHLESYPWDAFLSGVGRHVETDEFQDSLKALSHGDEFDIEEATENLTGAFRHLFIRFLEEKKPNDAELLDMEKTLWQRPEIIIANDYWKAKHRTKIMNILLQKVDTPSGGFAMVRDFFSRKQSGAMDYIIPKLKSADEKQRGRYLRCLALHPDLEVRRYAITNIDPVGFWRALTPSSVPCATILSLLEKVVGSEKFDDNFRKIFFNSIYKRLFFLTTRSDVLYTRGIIRILARLDFFLEDEYFEKLMRLLDYVNRKEKVYNIKDPIFKDHINNLRNAKERKGSLNSESPDFTGIPPVVLRKLARDGHYWLELAKHPIFKIARETIPHINTQDRALRAATQRNVNQEVLRAIGKRRDLFSSRTNRLALLTNPRTPPTVSLDYIPDLDKRDMEVLLRTSSIHPELRRFLQQHVR